MAEMAFSKTCFLRAGAQMMMANTRANVSLALSLMTPYALRIFQTTKVSIGLINTNKSILNKPNALTLVV
jgi:hypothetical protein